MKFWQSKNNPQCKLSQKNLLDISEEINQKYTPFDNHHHHQRELVLMPVDPINLYAYWNLTGSSENYEICDIDKQLALRVYSIPELSEQPDRLQLSFDIQVYGFCNQQKVPLPVAATAYSAAVGEINADNSFSALAVSETIHVPREKPVSGASVNSNDNILKINNEQEKYIIGMPDLQETPFFRHSIKNSHNKLAVDALISNKVISAVNNLETQQSETYILRNFNDYGYDLKIHADGSFPGFKGIMSRQDINTRLSDIKAIMIDKNISGQGRLL